MTAAVELQWPLDLKCDVGAAVDVTGRRLDAGPCGAVLVVEEESRLSGPRLHDDLATRRSPSIVSFGTAILMFESKSLHG